MSVHPFVRVVVGRPWLVTAAAFAVLVAVGLTLLVHVRLSQAILTAWNLSATLYLTMAARIMFAGDADDLRRRAETKFGADAYRMFFTRAGLEQATRSTVAGRRAARLAAAGVRTLADLGCGIGADAIAAVGRVRHPMSQEQDVHARRAAASRRSRITFAGTPAAIA